MLSIQVDDQTLSADGAGILHTAYISIGSNIGNTIENCKKGLSSLGETKGIQLKRLSKFYKTEPVDYLDQAWFINAVIEISTSLEPVQLFNCLKFIEKEAGRIEDKLRFGPRILDLDIIFYDNVILKTNNLEIPHPRMHNRRFVLRPLCDINPNLIHPVFQRTVKDLLHNLNDKGQRIKEYK